MQKKGWKLLRIINGKYYSYSDHPLVKQEYFLEDENFPKLAGSGMFVFNTLQHAKDFSSEAFYYDEKYCIKRVTGELMENPPRYMCYSVSKMKWFWDNFQSNSLMKDWENVTEPPIGTLFFKSITFVGKGK